MLNSRMIIACAIGCTALLLPAAEITSKGQRCPECGRYYEKYHVCNGR